MEPQEPGKSQWPGKEIVEDDSPRVRGANSP